MRSIKRQLASRLDCRRVLVFYVLQKGFNISSAANANTAIGAVPEVGLPEVGLQVFSILLPDFTGRNRLQVFHQVGRLDHGMSINQKMNMVGFPTELSQFALPFQQQVFEDLL